MQTLNELLSAFIRVFCSRLILLRLLIKCTQAIRRTKTTSRRKGKKREYEIATFYQCTFNKAKWSKEFDEIINIASVGIIKAPKIVNYFFLFVTQSICATSDFGIERP